MTAPVPDPARVRVEPVRRGSVRPLDPGRPTTPVLEQPRFPLRQAGLPVPDKPSCHAPGAIGRQVRHVHRRAT